MAFDYAQAKADGYTDEEIQAYLAQTRPKASIPAKAASSVQSMISHLANIPVEVAKKTVSGPKKAARIVTENPEGALDALPAIGATADIATGAILPGIALSAAGGAVGSLAKQAAKAKNPPRNVHEAGKMFMSNPEAGMGVAKETGKEAALAAATTALLPGAAKVAGKLKPTKQTVGSVVEVMGGLVPGSGKVAIDFPEVTRKNYYSSEKVKNFVDGVGTATKSYEDEATQYWLKVAKDLDDANKGVGKIERLDVQNLLDDTKAKLGMRKDKVEKGTSVYSAIEDIQSSLDNLQELNPANLGAKTPKSKLNLQEALDLRQKIDQYINFDDTVPEFAKGQLKTLRGKLDGLIKGEKGAYKEFAPADEAFANAKSVVKNVKKSLKIDAEKDIDKYMDTDLGQAETRAMGILGAKSTVREGLDEIGKKVGVNLLEEADKLAASGGRGKQFEQPLRRGTGYGLLTGATGGVTGTLLAMGKPGAAAVSALGTLATMAGTSPRLIGAGIRAAQNPTIQTVAKTAAKSSNTGIKALLRSMFMGKSNDEDVK